MNIRTLCLLGSGGISLCSALLTLAAMLYLPTPFQSVAIGMGAVLALIAGWNLSSRIIRDCHQIGLLLSGDESHRTVVVKLKDFQELANALMESTQRWEKVAAGSRRQAQEFASMMQGLEQRSVGLQPDSAHLRALLSGLGNALKQQLGQCNSHLNEAQQSAVQAVEQGESQASSTAHLCAKLGIVHNYLDELDSILKTIADPAAARSELATMQNSLQDQLQGLESVITEISRCEQKLGSLNEPTKELSSTIQSIADLAARTDLLALNASIESLRAGEHGKGFGIVADEVRKMAEQITEATRELFAILDAIQLAITEAARCVRTNQRQLDQQSSDNKLLRKSVSRVLELSELENQYLQQAMDKIQDQRNSLAAGTEVLRDSSQSVNALQRLTQSLVATTKNISQSLSQAASVAQRLTACQETVAVSPEQDTGKPNRIGAPLEISHHATNQLVTLP